MAVDWGAVRAEYVNGGGSLHELAAKYGVSESSIEKKSSKERWKAAREAQRNSNAEKLQRKVASMKVASEANRIARVLNVADKLLRRIEQQADKMHLDARDIASLGSALRSVRETVSQLDVGEKTKGETLMQELLDVVKEHEVE